MGENLILFKKSGGSAPICNRRTATRITSGQQTWALNADDTVKITVESPFPQDYGLGDYIVAFGRMYRLNRLPKFKKTGAYEFRYDLEFEGIQYDLMRAHYDVTIDTTNNELQDVSGDSLTGNLSRFVDVLLSNANRVLSESWVKGNVPETESDMTLTFGESDNCLAVLQTLCTKFEVEFEIVSKDGVNTLNLYKQVGKTIPFTLQYGKGHGLYEIGRDNVNSSNIITRLKVYGSTENITSKYRADRLCLPNKSKGLSYIEDAKVIAQYGVFEARKNFDDIKPTYTGKVTGIVSGNVLQFYCAEFPFDLNAKETDGVTTKYLISGVEAKVHFNTGNLAGYEFTVKSYDHATHLFTLNAMTDERGNVFPSATSKAFMIAKGDTFKILDIAYPDDITAKAEAELEAQAKTYYEQNSQPKVQYSVTITKQWLMDKYNVSDDVIVGVFAPGDGIHIVDDDLGVDKTIRIKSFTRNVLDPYDYSLTISDISTNENITTRVISELIDIDKVLTINNLKDAARARANWRSSREVLEMVFDPDGDYYTDKIKPNSVDTLMLSVGAKSMQFGLMNTIFEPNYNGVHFVVKVAGGVLTHYTIDDNVAKSWVLADETVTLNTEEALYIYAKCERNGNAGVITFEQVQHKVDEDANYYYFWIGVLNALDEETQTRSIALTYGFTTINGRFIKTGRIESADGTTYFDLDNSEIGGRIVFTNNGTKKTLADLGAEALESKNYINNTLPGLLSDIQTQIDGKIETWFTADDPSENWKSTTESKKHVGDMWFNTAGNRLYTFTDSGASLYWEEVKNADAIAAYSAASKAQDTADGKRQVFTTTPYPPYDKGDLWVGGTSGDLYVCLTARTKGAYVSTDWGLATKYTDDSGLNTFISDVYNVDIADIRNQLDGVVETHFGDVEPTTTNAPAKDWTTTEVKEAHLGDLYYNNTTGIGYRWGKSGTTYAWYEIRDTGVTEALAKASQAQDTADGKRRVFTTTPYPPYDVGDLWTDGADLFVCNIAKGEGGTYAKKDWGKATEYTGDENLETFINDVFTPTTEELYNQIDGKLMTWYAATNPRDTDEWKEAGTDATHNGDLWFNTADNTLFRFVYNNGGRFWWSQIQDKTAIDAAEAASKAQDTADGKRRVFTSQPYPPYDVGDLWSQGASGDLLMCTTARATGDFTSSDWEKATKYTDNTALNTFVRTTYSLTINSLTSQIDGKVESWFQDADPSASWTTTAIKRKHVGDMWYIPSDSILSYYTSNLEWEIIENADAIAAYEVASKAQDTADGKRQVFVETPKPPYDIGDLWVDGTDLRRCITARTSNETYNPNDFVICVAYDNTKTTIDGGLVTSGTIQVAGDNTSILAGMTGTGTATDSIRFWAGASFENRATAPFRVQQDGKVVMTNADVSGKVSATSGAIGGFSIEKNMLKSSTTGNLLTLNGNTGEAVFANGNFKVNSNGSVEMKNVTATGGSFSGVVNISGGMIMKVAKTAMTTYNLDVATTVLITNNQSWAGQGNDAYCFVNLPRYPNVGQVLTIVNSNAHRELRIYANGNKIIPSCGNSIGGEKQWIEGTYLPLASMRAKQFIFDGSTWWQINAFEF